jgi:inosine/xanthosine triphosphatase
MSEEETLLGAQNRAAGARSLVPEADFWVGIEGGVQDHQGEMAAFAWVVVTAREAAGKSRTGTFFLPPRVAELIRGGKELGEADDLVFGRTNSKQENGAIGLLTGDVIDRVQLYQQAIILALVPFRNRSLYS